MLIPIGHENMSARRWPIITAGLIAVNVVVFLFTYFSMEDQQKAIGPVRAHIIMLAAMHPELQVQPENQQWLTAFHKANPRTWDRIKDPNHDIIDAWDARTRLIQNPEVLQAEMDSLQKEYAELAGSNITQQYAFTPANPRPLTYVTSMFLHGGWMHLIFNMWFLWLAGFVLEDNWGRILYTIVYFAAGIFATQVHAWANPGSIVPSLGASGAVAGLMGAFLVRFPKMKIEMMWFWWFLLRIRVYRFKAAAYWLLPAWLLIEIFNGTLFGQSSGVAHWAHVGGFVFGAAAALLLKATGLEHVANATIEQKVSWTANPEIDQATELIETNQLDAAESLLRNVVTTQPDSVDAWALLQQIGERKSDTQASRDAAQRLCEIHLKARETDLAWASFEDFIRAKGEKLPAALWFEMCRIAETQQAYGRAVDEYSKLAKTWPDQRQSLMALMACARLSLKQLNQPQDALRFFQMAAASPVPHLDFEPTIEIGIRDAQKAMSPARV